MKTVIKVIALFALSSLAAVWAENITVYKSRTCGCCNEWIKIMESKGHSVDAKHPMNLERTKENLGVPKQLGSCHTAVINGYVFEGHIPEADILAFLDNPPEGAKGLATPGMPAMSPGMAPEGAEYKDFKVIGFDEQGKFFLFNEY